MAFFNVTPSERVNTLTETFDQGLNTGVREDEAKPGMFDEFVGATAAGVVSGFKRSMYAEYDPFTGDPDVDRRKSDILDSLKRLRPDATNVGSAGQIGFGLTEPLSFIASRFMADPITSVLSPQTLAMSTTLAYEPAQKQLNIADGMDPKTAEQVARTQATAMGLGTILPVSAAGNLATRILTGGGLNLVVGAGERAETGRILRANGYEEMAKQYSALDAKAALSEFILGGVFGGVFGGRPGVRVNPDVALPSTVDAALTGNQSVHAAVDTAPGIPVDGYSAQAHSTALNTAIEQLAFGDRVNVENLLTDAGFLGNRPDFNATAIIRDELDRAGFTDVANRVRELETAAKERGLYVEPSDLNVVLNDEPVAVKVGGIRGSESAVKIGNDYVPTEFRLVESGDVRATMDKADNQYRDRTRVASEQQIQEAAANLDPRLLGDAPVMDYGAPVLTADGKIIAGNGRAAFIDRAYDTNAGESYREYLKSNAEALGLSAREIDGMQNPVLVRVLQRDVDVRKSAILSNEGGALGMSALEQAKVDGERLGDFRAFEFGEDGAVSGVANMPFIRSWVGQFPQNQRSRLMDADGRLSAEGQRRLQNAVMYRAYGDSPTLARLVEATDPGSRNIVTALTRMAARVADTREAIARGELYPFDLADDLVGAVEKFASLRDTGLGVNEWVNQIDAFGDGLSGEARALVVMLDRNIRSAKAITDFVAGYYDRLAALGDPKQGSMFEAATPTKQDVFAPMLDATEVMYSRAQTETPAFKKWFEGSKVVDAEGKPLVVYHGTPTPGFDTFDPSQIGRNFNDPAGFFFSSSTAHQVVSRGNGKIEVYNDGAGQYAGDEGAIYPVYLRMKNPKIIEGDADGAGVFSLVESRTRGAGYALQDALAEGYDGIIVRDVGANPDAEVLYSVPNSNQIKSAIGNRGTFDPANPSILYGRGGTASTVADLTSTFKAQFGKDAQRLIDAARVEIVQSVSDLPARSDATPHPGDVGGMYDPRTGTSFIVADNTAPSQIRGRVLHEIGVHAGFEEMLGPQLYADVLAQVETRLSEADPVFLRARELASENAARPEHIPQETLAYLVENAPESRLGRRIIAAVRQWLYRVTGGRFVDLTTEDLVQMASAALRRQARVDQAALGADVMYQAAFHGSPHDFERFSTEHIGSGEGAQAFGWGLYFAENPAIAGDYHRRLSDPAPIEEVKLGSLRFGDFNGFDYTRKASQNNLENIRASLAEELLIDENMLRGIGAGGFQEHVLKTLDEKIEQYKDEWPEAVKDAETLRRMLSAPGAVSIRFGEQQGGVYQVDIPDEVVARALDWDKPLSQQGQEVRKSLEGAGFADNTAQVAEFDDALLSALQTDEMVDVPKQPRDPSGEEIYHELTRRLGSDKAASQYLDSIGIHGIKYDDAPSRGSDEGTHNIVVFNDENVKITHKDGNQLMPPSDSAYSRNPSEVDAFYRVSSDAIIAPADELSPTTMIPTGEAMEPIAIATERADAQIAEAATLEPGFLSAVECALVAGE